LSLPHLAFTGTRKGLTPQQVTALSDLLEERWVSGIVFHLGDTIGADEQARALGYTAKYRLHGHPSTSDDQRAFGRFNLTYDPLPPLERNRVMVDSAHHLIACPVGTSEELRSGTWATVRYARRKGVPITIIWPDGSIKEER
jgi:hypothetical protein